MNIPLEGPVEAQDSFYLPTPTTPEEAFKAIGRLRRAARDEIDRLIQFLDQTDNHMEREEAVDDVPCDDNELDGSSVDGEGEDDEPSLGSHETPTGTSYSCRLSDDGYPDAEFDNCDQEPSLGGAGMNYASSDQRDWARGKTDDTEDEHDGCEPDVDDEPSLGSFDRMMDQTKSTWNAWNVVEEGEVDPSCG